MTDPAPRLSKCENDGKKGESGFSEGESGAATADRSLRDVSNLNERILVTGASGFVGSRLMSALAACGRSTRAALRKPELLTVTAAHDSAVVGDLGATTDWRAALDRVGTVVHLAARVHVMQERLADSLAEFRRVNVAATLNLAQQAAQEGIRRFVFISSAKVNGESTLPGSPFLADDVPAPADAYSVSKHEAELGLLELAGHGGFEVVIIRPVLVYGPGVKANFLTMMRWLNWGLPLPLGAIHNQRSLIGVDNLVDLIVTCLDHPAAANQIFMASDGEDVSTTDLLRRTARALERPARLLPVPASLLAMVARVLGKRDVSQRLSGSLQVDIGKTCSLLNWAPSVTLDAGLALATRHFLNELKAR